MRQLRSVPASLRAFWADPAQRRVLMWVLAAVGAVILVYGVVQAARAHLDYQDRTDALEAAEQQAVALEQSLGLTNGGDAAASPQPEATADATAQGDATPQAEPASEDQAGLEGEQTLEISESDAMLIFALRRSVQEAETAQIRAYNRRAGALQVIGLGVIVLALAYLVAPTGQRRAAASDVPPGPGA